MLKWLEHLLDFGEAASLLRAADDAGAIEARPDGNPLPLNRQLIYQRRRREEYQTGAVALIFLVAVLLGCTLIPFALQAGIPPEVPVGSGVVAGGLIVWAKRTAIRRLAERLTRRDVEALRSRP